MAEDRAGSAMAVAAQLVAVDDTRVRFRHPLVRSAIRQAAGPAAAPEHAHAALAGVLAGEPDRRTWHRAAAVVGGDEAIAAELEATAAAAPRGGSGHRRRGARACGGAHADRARRGGRLLQAAELGVRAGPARVVERLLDEVETYELAPLDRARVTWIRESFDDGVAGGAAGAAALVESPSRRRPPADRGARPRPARRRRAALLVGRPRRRARASASSRIADRLRPRRRPRLVAILGWADPIDSGAEVVPAPARGRGRRGRRRPRPAPYGMAATAVADHELAASSCAPRSTAYATTGRSALLAQALVLRGWSAVHLGAWPAAVADLEEAGRLASESSQPYGPLALARARRRWPGCAATATARTAGRARSSGSRCPAARPRRSRTVQLARGIASLAVGDTRMRTTQLRRLFDPGDPAHH